MSRVYRQRESDRCASVRAPLSGKRAEGDDSLSLLFDLRNFFCAQRNALLPLLVGASRFSSPLDSASATIRRSVARARARIRLLARVLLHPRGVALFSSRSRRRPLIGLRNVAPANRGKPPSSTGIFSRIFQRDQPRCFPSNSSDGLLRARKCCSRFIVLDVPFRQPTNLESFRERSQSSFH